MKRLKQRIADWLLETRIARVRTRISRLIDAGRPDEVMETWNELKGLIRSRSPQQIARMERARGLR